MAETRSALTRRCTLTRDLLDAAQAELAAGADPATLALAHVGAGIMVMARVDPVMAERVAAAIEPRSPH
ncbi:MAG: hypothetical protein L6Q83_06515 [Gammaproteobacteria bacterium]|nr:hypothetical protein [Gammaproteobacteria bacterium]